MVKRGHEMHRLLFVAGFLICTASLDAEQMAGLATAQEGSKWSTALHGEAPIEGAIHAVGWYHGFYLGR